jgi:hypothetical protein
MERFSSLAGKEQRSVAQTGAEWDEKERHSACIVVGWLGGKPDIVAFTSEGSVTSYWQTAFCAEGAGKVHAWVATATLRKSVLSPYERFEMAMNVAVETVCHCQGR